MNRLVAALWSRLFRDTQNVRAKKGLAQRPRRPALRLGDVSQWHLEDRCLPGDSVSGFLLAGLALSSVPDPLAAIAGYLDATDNTGIALTNSSSLAAWQPPQAATTQGPVGSLSATPSGGVEAHPGDSTATTNPAPGPATPLGEDYAAALMSFWDAFAGPANSPHPAAASAASAADGSAADKGSLAGGSSSGAALASEAAAAPAAGSQPAAHPGQNASALSLLDPQSPSAAAGASSHGSIVPLQVTGRASATAPVRFAGLMSGGSGGISGGQGTTFGGLEGGVASAGSNLAAVSPLVQATEGAAVTAVVATFMDADPNASVSDYTATVNWGDGTATSTGSVGNAADGGFNVSGTHTYAEAGSYTIQATITLIPTDPFGSSGGSGGSWTASGTAQVADAPLTGSPGAVTATEGVAVSPTLATFSDADPNGVTSDYSAVIDWGDGSPTVAGTVGGSAGAFNVSGTHTYAEAGSYTVTVAITDEASGSNTVVQETANVAEQPLSAGGISVSVAPEGATTTLSSTFSDANTLASAGDWTATINWGDGSSDGGAISGSASSFSVTGGHDYNGPGSYTISVTAADAEGATVTQTATVNVSAAALTPAGMIVYLPAGVATSSIPVGTFTDANLNHYDSPLAITTNYTATINWGDGTTADTNSTILANSSSFGVLGNHTYAAPGSYAVSVTVQDADGGSTTINSTAVVSTMKPTGSTVSASEGVALSGVPVATFTDSQPGSYTASIDWGDGSTPSSGTISGSSGSYTVSGSHTYTDGGTYPTTVTITNAANLSALAVGTAQVADAALSASGRSLSVAQGVAFTGLTVATFTDPDLSVAAGDYGVSINWGDGNGTDVGTVTGSNGSFTVTGGHTYQAAGPYSVSVTISDPGGSTTTVSDSATVTRPLAASATNLSASEGIALNNVSVATFTDSSSASSFTASIDWGDGTVTTGTVSGSGGTYTVSGSYTYSNDFPYTTIVTVNDSNGNTDTAYGQATVSESTLAISGATVQPKEAVSGTFTVATFTDTNPTYGPGDYEASIDWGDGTVGPGQIATNSGGGFSISGSHTYLQEGSYAVQVTLNDPSRDNTVSVTDQTSVGDAPLAVTTASLTATQGVALKGVTVATFTDLDLTDVSTDYTASINWGDGTSSGIVSGANGLFSVDGSHVYSSAGTYTTSITITDPGNHSITVSGSAVVAATPVYTVATFFDSVGGDTATIDWGDGTGTSAGTITGSNGSYTVTGSHAYAEEGTYLVTVTISRPGVPSVVVQSHGLFADDFRAGSQQPPAAPLAPEEPKPIPGHEVVFEITKGSGGKSNGAPPGVRIHVDDNFFREDYMQGGLVMADNVPTAGKIDIDALLKANDTNLVQGTVTIGPNGQNGQLMWTVPNNKVTVWWKPKATWELVPAFDPAYVATGAAIPVVIMGMTPSSDVIKASFTAGGQTKTGSVTFNVYTGLVVDGAGAAKLVTQLTTATTYNLLTDASGDVWRKSRQPVKKLKDYQVQSVQALGDLLTNEPYRTEGKSSKGNVVNTPSTKVHGVNGDSFGFDMFFTANFYVDNYALITTKIAGDDGIKMMSAALLHGLTEQYYFQVLENEFKTKDNAVLDHDAGGAFGAGTTVEEKILGWGDRTQDPARLADFLKNAPAKGKASMKFVYTKGGKQTVFEMVYDFPLTPPGKISDLKLQLPK
jgi:hypothetical protein